VNWGAAHLKGRGLRTLLCKLAWWTTIYHLWNQRTTVIHAGKIYIEDQLVGIIKKEIKRRIESKKCKCGSLLNRTHCSKWEINFDLIIVLP
jgi:hypothetical protein